MMIQYDIVAHLISQRLGIGNEQPEFMYHSETGRRFGKRPQPTHQAFGHPGHMYSIRPDLTRSGSMIMLGRYAPPIAVIAAYGYAAKMEIQNLNYIAGSENLSTADKIRFMQPMY